MVNDTYSVKDTGTVVNANEFDNEWVKLLLGTMRNG